MPLDGVDSPGAGASHLRREIGEQPEAIARLLDRHDAAIRELAASLRAHPPSLVLIAARGSSDNAARYAQHLFGRLCGLPVALATPSLLTLYDRSVRLRDALVIGISQSGASPDIRGVVEDAARQGQATIAITNEVDSPLARAAGAVIDLSVGTEASVAATKTYTASLAAVAALAAALAGDEALAAELRAVPDAMARQLERPVDAGLAAGWDRCVVAGRGANYATAFEAALKIKELTGIAAEPFSPADLMHGPVAVLGPDHGLLAVAPSGPTLAGAREAAAAARSRGAPVVAITDRASELEAAGAAVLEMETVPEWLSPLVAVLPAQLLAVGLAEARGVDVDRPFGLNKVTETS